MQSVMVIWRTKILQIKTFITDRGFYLAVGGGAAQHGYSYVRDIIQNEEWNCRILDHSEDMALISVQGPRRWVTVVYVKGHSGVGQRSQW